MRARIPILITGLNPAIPCSLRCETLIVNAHGCAAQVHQPLELGMPVRLCVRPPQQNQTVGPSMRDNREATARIVLCQPIGGSQPSWMAGIELDKPGNLWGLTPSPEDWEPFETAAAESNASEPAAASNRLQLKMPVWPLASPAARIGYPAKASDEELKKQLAAQLEAIAKLQERLASVESLAGDEELKKQLAAQQEVIARLQGRLASVESLAGMVQKQLADAQQQSPAEVHGQIAGALTESLGPLREELAACRKKVEDDQQIRVAFAERLEQLPWYIEQHTHAAFRPLQERARAELERIIAGTGSQNQLDTARLQALQLSAEALQNELARARTSLESSLRGLPERIQEPIAMVVEDALAKARTELSAELARELEALHERGRLVTDELHAAANLLRGERDATSAQLDEVGAKREELRLWLAEQQAVYTKQVSQQFEQFASELANRSARVREEKIRSSVEIQAEQAEADLNQRLGPMLNRAADLRQEALSLLDALQRESERCQTQVRALLAGKDGMEAWIAERAADFQRTFHDALVETTGQIKGRLQMAVEMVEQPVAKLREEVTQQLQEQAGRQARQLRECGDEVSERLRGLQRDIENVVRESLRTQATETSVTFGREIAQAAQRSVEEWRSALARNLESITGLLGQQFPDANK